MISIAIVTYRRGTILLETLDRLLSLERPADEIVVVDQTLDHPPEVAARIVALNLDERIRLVQLPEPSIPHAMNVALAEARGDLVLFLDDDVEPGEDLVSAHLAAHGGGGLWAVVGQVLQPGESPAHFDEDELRRGPLRDLEFRFNHDAPCDVENVMAGNLSVVRLRALGIGGFDENYTGAAYRFETDFARRVVAAGGTIRYEPGAAIRHLKAETGGIRSFGDHKQVSSPIHTIGDYYFALHHVPRMGRYVARRLRRNVFTRFHARRPWTIPGKVLAEVQGYLLALRMYRRGRRLVAH